MGDRLVDCVSPATSSFPPCPGNPHASTKPIALWSRTLLAIAVLGLSLWCISSDALAQAASPSTQPAQASTQRREPAWGRNFGPSRRTYTLNNKKMPRISVKGNKFVDPNGNTILFRGLSISDPDKLEIQGHWSKDHFAKAKEMGASLIRIPVHPVAWRERTPAEYLKLLDQAVGWCTELDMYVMLDWHTIGNLETELFQDPMYETTKQETYDFWRTMARHYAGHNTVAFYELFNEPTTYQNQLGPVSWDAWKKSIEELITIIRAYNHQAIPLVAGFDWAYDLTPLLLEPHRRRGNRLHHPSLLQQAVPALGTEVGGRFRFRRREVPHHRHRIRRLRAAAGRGRPAGPGVCRRANRNAAYGPAIIKYLEGKGISWTVWCFDPEWGPTLIRNWNYDLTPSGEFAKAAMHGEIK